MKVIIEKEINSCMECHHHSQAGHFKYGILWNCSHPSFVPAKRPHLNPEGHYDGQIPGWCPVANGEPY